MNSYDPVLRLSYWPLGPTANWVLWVEQDSESNRLDRLWAGRVKLQDDPIATAHAVLYDAVQKLETTLGIGGMDPLF